MNLPALSPVVLLYGYPMFCERDHSDFFLFPSSFVCVLVFFFFFFFFLLNDIIPSGKECYGLTEFFLFLNFICVCIYFFFGGGGGILLTYEYLTFFDRSKDAK